MNIALITAAGQGKRMGGKIPKLLLPINNKPLLYYTVTAFYDNPQINRIVIVTNRKLKKSIEKMLKAFFPGDSKKIKLVPGGMSRSESVLNGIQYIKRYMKPKPKDIIVIHNGNNPLVTNSEISKSIKKAQDKGAAIVSHPIKGTLKETRSKKIHKTHNRSKFIEAQTPQTFTFKIIIDSLEKIGADYIKMTDESSLVEEAGHHVYHIPASEHNIKVTTQKDYDYIKHALGDIPEDYLMGIGQDSHEFSKSGKLVLGGVVVAGEKKLKANSDGDVLLHALCNALLQAIGEKSLGAFADNWCKVKKIKNSQKYLNKILKKVTRKGYGINNIGVMMEGKHPRIDMICSELKSSLAKLCKVPERRIGVTGTSGEELTSFGKGKGLQCFCIVSLKKK